MKRPHNEREARSGGNKKRVSTVNFDGTKEQVNRMTARDAPIPRKRRENFRQRSLRVTRKMHPPKRSNVLMVLIA